MPRIMTYRPPPRAKRSGTRFSTAWRIILRTFREFRKVKLPPVDKIGPLSK